MPHEPTNTDLLQQIKDLRAEVRELQRKTVPGQMTGLASDGESRFWSFTDKGDNPVVAEDVETGYGLATPLMNPVLYDVSLGGHMAGGWNVPNLQDGVTWNRDWFAHIPNVNPFLAVSLYIDVDPAVTLYWRLCSNGNQVIHESTGLTGRGFWHHSVPVKFQLANPGEVSFLALDIRVKQNATNNGWCRYSFGGVYGRNSLS